MLVLARRIDQSVMIGNDIKITIIDIKKDVVRLGISAPKKVSVYREEIFEEIQRENIASSMVDEHSLEEISRIFAKEDA
jgi:carbon storage regulator